MSAKRKSRRYDKIYSRTNSKPHKVQNTETSESTEPIEPVVNEVMETTEAEDSQIEELSNNCIPYDVVDQIWDMLADQTCWGSKPKLSLSAYLYIVLKKVYHEITIKDTPKFNDSGFKLSSDGETVIVNTNLIDQYGTYIYLIDSSLKKEDKRISYVSGSLRHYEGYGLRLTMPSEFPGPLRAWRDASETIFDPYDLDFWRDFDIGYKHILCDRVSRFPEFFQRMPMQLRSVKLVNAIESSLEMAKHDLTWARPFYDFTKGKVGFMLPLHIDIPFYEKPNVAVVLACGETGKWRIPTVLTMPMAYNNQRLFGRPSDFWNVSK